MVLANSAVGQWFDRVIKKDEGRQVVVRKVSQDLYLQNSRESSTRCSERVTC